MVVPAALSLCLVGESDRADFKALLLELWALFWDFLSRISLNIIWAEVRECGSEMERDQRAGLLLWVIGDGSGDLWF